MPDIEEIFKLPTDDTVESENHLLFIEEEEGEPLVLQLPDEYKDIVGVSEVRVPTKSFKKYILYTSAFVSDNNDLFKILHKLRGAGDNDVLEIHIDSPGGYVTEGETLANIMAESFKGRVKTILDPSGASMGAFLFGKGDFRIAYENSDIMYHNYSGGAFGKGGEIKASVDFSDRRLGRLFRKAFVDTGYFTEEEFNLMRIGQDYYFDVEEMCYRGICTHVIVGEVGLEAEDYIEYLELGFTIEEYVELKEQDEELELAKAIEIAIAEAMEEEDE